MTPGVYLPPTPTDRAWVESIGALEGYDFVSRRPVEQTFDLHRLIHLMRFCRNDACDTDTTGKISPNDDHTNREIWTGYLPHVLRLLERNEVKRGSTRWSDF
jgi:hypothetical protein